MKSKQSKNRSSDHIKIKNKLSKSKAPGDVLIEGKQIKPENADGNEIEKGLPLIIVEILEYISNSVLSKTIIRKSSGNISIMSFDSGEGLTEKISPFDTFAQIIDGTAEIMIDGKSNILKTGQGIIIPAHTSNIVKANERFKMILTVIKSGYE